VRDARRTSFDLSALLRRLLLFYSSWVLFFFFFWGGEAPSRARRPFSFFPRSCLYVRSVELTLFFLTAPACPFSPNTLPPAMSQGRPSLCASSFLDGPVFFPGTGLTNVPPSLFFFTDDEKPPLVVLLALFPHDENGSFSSRSPSGPLRSLSFSRL